MKLFLGKLIYLSQETDRPTGKTAYGAVLVSPNGEPIMRSGPYADVDAMAVDVRELRKGEEPKLFDRAEGFLWEPPAGEHWFGEREVVRFEGLSFHEMSRAQTILGV